MIGRWERTLLVGGALAGLSGVALSALSAHVTGAGSLETAARFLLLHAPVLLAIAALTGQRYIHRGFGRSAGFAIGLGLILFCGDLSVRALLQAAPIPLAAPTGGVVLMLGWGALALAAIARDHRA